MKKEILFNEELRKKWLAGAGKVAQAVGSTLGPCGRYFGLTGYKAPIITKDGVSVAKDIELSDPAENAGAQLFKEMSLKTNDEVGDGTTTTVVLGYEMLKEGMKAVEAGCQPIELKRGMDKASKWVSEKIKENTKEIKTEQELERVATISANNDEELGKIVAEAFKIAGKDGIVHAESTKGVNIELEESKGLTFDGGWASPFFVNNREKAEVNFEDALILLTDKKITMAEELEKFLGESVQQKKPLLIISEELSGEALNSTGASLKDCGPEFLGGAKIIKATKNETTIIGGCGDEKIIDKYVEVLKKLRDNKESEREKEIIDKRISRFLGSAVTLKIGAATETEAKEIKDRADDAICAVKAALKGGISEGAGTNYASYGLALEINDKEYPTEDMKRGAKIVKNALKKPLIQIAENTGLNGEVIYNNCFSEADETYKGLAYNAMTNEYGDGFAMGIVEPTEVQTTALKNANSIAGVMLVTGGANIKIEDGEDNK